MNAFTVSVPATSANLGPGFDCIGLALGIYNTFRFSGPVEAWQISIQGLSAPEMLQPEKNLAVRSYQATAEKYGKKPACFHLQCHNVIPFEGGMGSSATAVLAGVAAAHKIHGLSGEKKDILKDALTIENHPDNIAPAIFGGLIIAYVDEAGEPVIFPVVPKNPPACFIIHPHTVVNTAESRKKLPADLPVSSVIQNMARLAVTAGAFINGEYEYLFDSMKDNFHEPFRMNPHMDYPSLKQKLQPTGFYGWAISGSGPSVIMFCREVTPEIREIVRRYFAQKQVDYDAYTPAIDLNGISVLND